MTDAYEDGCVFCPENGKVSFLAESRLGYAVEALRPPVEGCILLIPKQHTENYFSLPSTWQAEEVDLLSQLIIAGYMDTVCNYTPSWNLSELGGRTITHLHHWWVPRSSEDPESVAYRKGTATLIGLARQSSALHML